MTNEIEKEKRIKGRAVSRGIAAGSVVIINSRGRRLSKVPIAPSDIDYELKRLRTAFKLADRSLRRLIKGSASDFWDSRAEIFRAQLEILRDPTLIQRMETEIQSALVNSEWAIQRSIKDFSERLGSVADLHIKERAIDVQDLGERLLNALSGEKMALGVTNDFVVVTDQLYPSALAEFGALAPVAIITERGGWTSHAFILARELGIPAITGVHGATRRLQDGMKVLVDGFDGELFINPSSKRLSGDVQADRNSGDEEGLCEIFSAPRPATTTDAVDINLLVNLDVPKSFEQMKDIGAMGIGLFRSEFLIQQGKGFPSEKDQFNAYSQLGRLAGEFRARIRTFDISSGEAQGDADHFERNPALGLRATRLMLTHEPKEFRVQLRSLLCASVHGNIDIVLPMVSDISEVHAVREILESETQKLSERGIAFGKPRLGVMLEVPSLLFVLDRLIEEVDFISLGTNDLVQYLLAVDRDNESVADSFRTLHPSVLKAIKSTIDVGVESGKEVLICGEMAGSHIYAPVLVGLGARNLSMNVRAISKVRNVIKSISFESAHEMSSQLLRCDSALESEQSLLDFYSSHWSSVFPKDFMANSMLARNRGAR